MKIACCQFNPTLAETDANMARADDLLERYGPGDIDILVLPEMAFTGYVFESSEEIEPYLEDEETGPSVMWAKKQAVRLESFVVVGYPERTKDGKCYNSLCCINPKGERVKTYRKAFLYKNDEYWALEGPGFESLEIEGLGKVGFAICMDINPYQFKADFTAYEFARFHAAKKTRLVIGCMSWVKGGDVLSTIRYWVQRLLPLVIGDEEVCFVASNRIGTERGVTFAGGSCLINMGNQTLDLKGYLDENEEDVLVIDV
ncbi:carbon-nitrogen hydrolase [Lichtheimia corymbifera JMRC:FSU:9682]|uniref:Carbon-nitrogen hydrolase n=1 Tax=Lichtheimia corymbifera JMRC:FSU:9682 TaxID=1263082 RepID=A0A068RJ79_9FUNG|nr:carbon-nitrogen hydrolase [Lichtheimia corymbifera JMRC:FSU:9682]